MGVLAPDYAYINEIKKQCPEADISVIMSKKVFRAYAAFEEGSLYLPIPTIGNGIVFVHEFGHAFGGLHDEYLLEKEWSNLIFGNPNCVTEEKAKTSWGEHFTSEWRGCGGDCNKNTAECKETKEKYVLLTENSLMNNHNLKDGDKFNDVCKEWLINKLNNIN